MEPNYILEWSKNVQWTYLSDWNDYSKIDLRIDLTRFQYDEWMQLKGVGKRKKFLSDKSFVAIFKILA